MNGPNGLVVKDTKTHGVRRVALDPKTAEVLAEHRRRAELDAALEPATLAALRAGARGRAGVDPRANIVARVNALLRPNYVRP